MLNSFKKNIANHSKFQNNMNFHSKHKNNTNLNQYKVHGINYCKKQMYNFIQRDDYGFKRRKGKIVKEKTLNV